MNEWCNFFFRMNLKNVLNIRFDKSYEEPSIFLKTTFSFFLRMKEVKRMLHILYNNQANNNSLLHYKTYGQLKS
jgi:hypothetical protein